jgi:hypothetical protein
MNVYFKEQVTHQLSSTVNFSHEENHKLSQSNSRPETTYSASILPLNQVYRKQSLGSIPDEIIGLFNLPNALSGIMVLGIF